mgnify:CR=1 FL=1
MSSTPRRLSVGWGAIGFVLLIAVITGLYLFDTVSVSMNRNNVILVLPLSILVLLLSVVVIVRNIRFSPDDTDAESVTSADDGKAADTAAAEVKQSVPDMLRALVLLGLLGVFVFSYRIIGFDVATFIFIASSLLLLGHRNWLFVLLYSLFFTLVVIGGAMWLLSYPMPMLIL